MPETQDEKIPTAEEAVDLQPEPSEISETEEAPLTELEALRAENEELKSRMLRLAAEYDNFRKRSLREKESAHADSKAWTIAQLLPVIDNFERAAVNTSADYPDYRKGVEMTFAQFMEILSKLGIEAFGDEGEVFDPEMHNAVMHIDDESLENNVITQVFQNGYKMGDKILRHAMVKVAN